MEDKITASPEKVYIPSENLIVKEIRGDFLIFPSRDGMVDLEDEFFKISERGRAIWDKLNSHKTLKEISKELSAEYDASLKVIEKDLLCLVGELLKRGMVVASN